jgi:uncharacterized protein YoxC
MKLQKEAKEKDAEQQREFARLQIMVSQVKILEGEVNCLQTKNEQLSEQMQQKIAKLRKEAKKRKFHNFK